VATTTLAMYQGEDWSQQLSFFLDKQQTQPCVFDNPVMDIRDPNTGAKLATFDSTGAELGSATVPSDGVLNLSMPYTSTDDIPAGQYALDIFADIAGQRKAIVKRGLLTLSVTARVTEDDNPVATG